jgi:hypothetical protein
MLSVSAIQAGSLTTGGTKNDGVVQAGEYRTYPVLYVDDEPQNLVAFATRWKDASTS